MRLRYDPKIEETRRTWDISHQVESAIEIVVLAITLLMALFMVVFLLMYVGWL